MRRMRARVALAAFLAELAFLAALVRLPRATAAGFFRVITIGSIPPKIDVDKAPTVR